MAYKTYYIYIITNRPYGNIYIYIYYIYIGVTNNLKRCTTEHHSGKGGRFSSRYHLKQLVYYESFYDIRKAIKREKQLKRWHRQWKAEDTWCGAACRQSWYR